MARRLKLLASLSTAALTGAVALGGCGGAGEGGEGEGEAAGTSVAQQGEAAVGEGEGEGGESEGAAAAGADRVTYLANLMLISGHLETGAQLYAAGEAAMAAAHMKHPQDEIYAGLKPAFDRFGAKGFDAELAALAASVEGGAAVADVDDGLAAVRAALAKASGAAQPTAKEIMLAAAQVLRTAGEEFDLGVKGGAVVNAHEYQDAHGFIQIAGRALTTVKAPDGATDAALGLARDQAALALAAAPTALPPERVEATSAAIYGAAARIEIAALGLS